MMEENYRIEVYHKDFIPLEHSIISIEWIIESFFYQIQGQNFKEKELEKISSEIFSDSVTKKVFYKNFDPQSLNHLVSLQDEPPDYAVEVCYRDGVNDNTGKVATEAITLLFPKRPIECFSGKVFFIKARKCKKRDIENLITSFYANQLIEKINVETYQDFSLKKRFNNIKERKFDFGGSQEFGVYSFECSLDKLEKLSKEKCWALNRKELEAIQHYYLDQRVKAQREKWGLPTNPTDVEIEILAQTWSEHCKHKIFSAHIHYSESDLPKNYKSLGCFSVNSLYKSRIQQATKTVQEKRNLDWTISVFSDNAGIVRYSNKIDLAIKVETHNSPSALDPYGGALTGILGVNRDILGAGLGARPICNTNVLCFAPPCWPGENEKEELPINLFHPRQILEGVHRGIKDGGNKSGIPTVNGAIYFDYNYAGKPLVYCGTVGVLDACSSSGRALSKKYHKSKDRVVIVGGKTGIDGIHGATFSSLELSESSPTTAVQIGDPSTQKRLSDFLMEAQKKELFEGITDNGAGGLSSSVGEMAEKTGGAKIDLGLLPTKYPGVCPFELMVSESQERMTFAVSPEKVEKFVELAKDYDVEATDIGEFTDRGYLEVFYDKRRVASLDIAFVHEGLPQMELKANFQGEKFTSFKENNKKDLSNLNFSEQIKQSLHTLMSSLNIASKEKWVRQYDHEVQAATVIKPFVGITQSGPGNAGVLSLAPHGGGEDEAIAVACGMNPRLSYFDGYLMAQYAIDEAVRNLIAHGVSLDKISLVDNFCWPDPIESRENSQGSHYLAQLVRTCEALYDMSCVYGMPYISGKDSMKNDFTGKLVSGEKIKISVPPTLLITAIGYLPHIERVVTSDYKKEGDMIFFVGDLKSSGLKYSEWDRYFFRGQMSETPPCYLNPNKSWEVYKKLNLAMQRQWVESCHDISDGGLLCCLAECCFGNDLGAEVALDSINTLEHLFCESGSRFVVTVKSDNAGGMRQLLGEQIHYLGIVQRDYLVLTDKNKKTVNFSVQELKNLWRSL